MNSNIRVYCLVAAMIVSAANLRYTVAQVPDFSTMSLNFEDVTAARINPTVAELEGNEKSIDLGDYDNDGDLDVVIAIARGDFSQRRNKLYRNDDGILNEVSGTDIMPEFSLTDTSRTALFRDLDHDGWLDILIVNDALSGTSTVTSPGRTRFYRNVDGQGFINDTLRLNNPSGAASSAVAADFDGNGYLDLVFCNHPNSTQDSITFNNINGNGAGNFEELTSTQLPQDAQYGKHVLAADMNGDEQIDLLVANHMSANSFIYYNNNESAGSGTGDFRYTSPGANTVLPSSPGSIRERTLAPADFNNDGLMDFYFSNEGGFGSVFSDAIYVNTGNDANNRAIFASQPLSDELNDESIRAEVDDFDGDGRIDLIVVTEDKRPYLFRNTSENGEVRFVEWTPVEFGLDQEGWGITSGDLAGDARPDLFVGAYNDDFLFENVGSPQFNADDLNGQLPPFHDSDPIMVVGQVTIGDENTFVFEDLPSGAEVSLLLRSLGDANVEVVAGNQDFLLDRPGNGTDEAVHFTHAGGDLTVTVSMIGISFDGNGDGQVNLLDVGSLVDCLTGASATCDAFDTNDDGLVTLLEVSPFVDRLINGSSEEAYFLEILSRSN